MYNYGNDLHLLPILYYLCISKRINIMTCRETIIDYAALNTPFKTDSLWSYLSSLGEISKSTMACTLAKLSNEGALLRTGRGEYALSKDKMKFTAQAGELEKKIYEALRKQFPFAAFCIYNARILSPLHHHISANVMTYVETDRVAVESVFTFLQQENYSSVWMEPDETMVYRYIDMSKGGIIVKSLVTEAPIEVIDGIPSPTIEKLLVDICKDSDYSYLRGSESHLMWENAKELYNINQSRLGRYARRRGLKI